MLVKSQLAVAAVLTAKEAEISNRDQYMDMSNQELVLLIVEDDKGHFELVKRNLWRSCPGVHIYHFSDGQQFVDYLNENFSNANNENDESDKKYVLILDLKLPKINGLEILRRLRQHGALKYLFTVILTTTDSEQEIRQCYEYGCNFYITKPSDYNRFMEVIEVLGSFISLLYPGMADVGSGNTQ